MEGLFRVSGSGIEVQRLREQIELRYSALPIPHAGLQRERERARAED
jgi:hypothetical protein